MPSLADDFCGIHDLVLNLRCNARSSAKMSLASPDAGLEASKLFILEPVFESILASYESSASPQDNDCQP